MSPQKIALRLIVVFVLIIISSAVGNFYFFHESNSTLSNAAIFVSSIAMATLTHGSLAINYIPSIPHLLFTILMLEAIGLFFNTTLLWQCRQLFGSFDQRKAGFRNAFIITFWISLIAQILLFAFFLYSVPEAEVVEGRKVLVAVAMSAGSFHLAGIPFYNSFFSTGFLEQNFIVQLGIASGITFGSLGIFVIHELFSIPRLRQRLADPSIDWSFITKVSVFVGGAAIVMSSVFYWIMEKDRLLSGKNITESAIATVYEVSAARGFGVSIFNESPQEPLTSFPPMTLSGPFSNGGGLTILIFVALAYFLKSGLMAPEIRIAGHIIRALIAISAMSLFFVIGGILTGAITLTQVIPAFTGNSVLISNDMTFGAGLWLSWLLLTGKIALIVACFWLIGISEKSKT